MSLQRRSKKNEYLDGLTCTFLVQSSKSTIWSFTRERNLNSPLARCWSLNDTRSLSQNGGESFVCKQSGPTNKNTTEINSPSRDQLGRDKKNYNKKVETRITASPTGCQNSVVCADFRLLETAWNRRHQNLKKQFGSSLCLFCFRMKWMREQKIVSPL